MRTIKSLMYLALFICFAWQMRFSIAASVPTAPKLIRSIDYGKPSTIVSLTYSPNGSCIAAATDGGEIRIWNIASGRLLHKLPVSGNYDSNRVAFTSDSKILAVTGYDMKSVSLFAFPSCRKVRTLNCGDAVTCFAFHPSTGDLIISCRSKVCRWKKDTWRLEKTVETGLEWTRSFAINDQGNLLVAVGYPPGPHFVTPPPKPHFSGVFVDLVDWKVVDKLMGPDTSTYSACFSHDGKFLTTSSEPNSFIRTWDVQARQLKGTSSSERGRASSVIVGSPTSDEFACVSYYSRYARICIMPQGRASVEWLVEPRVRACGPSCASFSPDGKFIAIGCITAIRLWRLPDK